jgi:hypothetical protein
MSSHLSVRRLIREGDPIAMIVFFWALLASISTYPLVSTGLRVAGLLMALLYALVRGVHLSRDVSPGSPPTEHGALLKENARVLGAAGAWFLTAVIFRLAVQFGPPHGVRLIDIVLDALFFTLPVTGVYTVILHVIVVGVSRLSDAGIALRLEQTTETTNESSTTGSS